MAAAATFDNANLRGAIFNGTVLSGATFLNSDLAGASFRDARLDGANLATARNANQADFSGACQSAETQLPAEIYLPSCG
jgi:uncharacterized protein YjbI with pentapeptide repeats